MPLPTIEVLDGNGDPQTVGTLPGGRAADADSVSVALSNEDIAALAQPVPGNVTGAGIGTASGEILAADSTRKVVVIQNVSQSATIAVRQAVGAALYVAGNFMAGPMGFVVIQGAAAQAQIFAVSDTASTPITISIG